ncbi:hypothetical protein D3C87_1043180 [compost metagenome]
MTFEEFQTKCKEPVDTEKAMAALQRFVRREATLPVPATPEDDDILISRALSELEELREKIKFLDDIIQEIDTHTRSTKEPLSYIHEKLRKYWEYD